MRGNVARRAARVGYEARLSQPAQRCGLNAEWVVLKHPVLGIWCRLPLMQSPPMRISHAHFARPPRDPISCGGGSWPAYDVSCALLCGALYLIFWFPPAVSASRKHIIAVPYSSRRGRGAATAQFWAAADSPPGGARLVRQPASGGGQVSFQGCHIGGRVLFMEVFDVDGNRPLETTLAELSGEGRVDLTRSERDVLNAPL